MRQRDAALRQRDAAFVETEGRCFCPGWLFTLIIKDKSYVPVSFKYINFNREMTRT